MSIEKAWDTLETIGISEQTLQVVTSINGYSLDTLEDILYAATGLNFFDQLENY